MPVEQPPNEQELVPLLKRVVDGVERLVSNHLALARMELGEDARALGRRVVALVSFVPLAVVGFALVAVAGALFLAPLLGTSWAFLLVGGVLLIAGVVGTWMAKNRPDKAEPVLNDTGEELGKTADTLGTLVKGREDEHELH